MPRPPKFAPAQRWLPWEPDSLRTLNDAAWRDRDKDALCYTHAKLCDVYNDRLIMTEKPLFEIGRIVRLNNLGRSRSKFPDRWGVVVGSIGKGRTQIKVHWNGLTTAEIVHVSFLQLAAREESVCVDAHEGRPNF
jgi:hypothetical protein